jgi:drug/metabolite transporter (DMT)-like permease
MSSPSYSKVIAIVFVGVFGISTAAIFVRLSTIEANLDSIGFNLFLAASRLGISFLLMLPFLSGKSNVKPQSKALFYAVVAGVCLALHYASWFLSLSYTSIVASTTVVTTSPVWIALISWIFLNEKPSRRVVIGIVLAILGGLIIGYDGAVLNEGAGKNPLLGIFLAFIGSVVYGLYFLAGREAQKRGLSTGLYALIAYGSAAISLLPLPFLFGNGYGGYPALVYLYIFLMAIISQVVGQTSLNWSLRWISPITVTLAVMFEPVFSGILAYAFFKEVPSMTLLFGAITILLGVGVAAQSSASK